MFVIICFISAVCINGRSSLINNAVILLTSGVASAAAPSYQDPTEEEWRLALSSVHTCAYNKTQMASGTLIALQAQERVFRDSRVKTCLLF